MTGGALALAGCGAGRRRSEWRGILFGTEVAITAVTAGGAEIDWAPCEAEMLRLEKIFSLTDPDSPLARLNRDGRLDGPPEELREVTLRALELAERSGGVFDPTIQPYWAWLRERLATGGTPDEGERARLLALVDYRGLRVGDDGLRFERAGMGLTLNAMAQGFVTDRVTAMLEARGIAGCLVHIGEFAARGRDVDGKRWRVAVRAGGAGGRVMETVTLADEALAVSSGAGFRMSATGKWTHLLSPATGESPAARRTVAVTAPEAVVADGLATACSLMSAAAGRELVKEYPGAAVRFYD
ncbi:MAG: FAD:protein FMN transferase [Akkermansiaceae bacterium]|nr:FAD:protein FMN transferase [Akkermansiaceae bacterium]